MDIPDKWKRIPCTCGYEGFIKELQKENVELQNLILEAQKYITDAHAGEVRDITPLEALQEQALYYEDMIDEIEG